MLIDASKVAAESNAMGDGNVAGNAAAGADRLDALAADVSPQAARSITLRPPRISCTIPGVVPDGAI